MKNFSRIFTKTRISGALILFAPFIAQSEASAYCLSKGNSTSYEWIESFELGSFNNISASNGGYADFTQQIIDLAPGTVAIYLEPGFRSSSYTEHWRVWLDFNQDDDFQATELVFSGSSSSSLNGSITIPNDVPDGETRMRVSMKYGNASDACGNFTYGEVEDYTVRFDTLDTSSPEVILTTPSNAATNIAVANDISITFSEQIDPFSINQSSVTLSSLGVNIEGNTSVNDAVVRFEPNEPLIKETSYDVVVAGLTDLAGNPLLGSTSWSFTTEIPDTVSPVITQTSPSADSSNVSDNVAIQVIFSEEMDPQTFTNSTFTVNDGISNQSGNISVIGNKAEFNVDSTFAYSTTYTVSIDGTVTDLAGNALGQNLNFDFTTKDFQAEYCSSFGENFSSFWVGSTRINNLTTSYQGSSFTGYRDSTWTSYDVNRFSNLVNLTPGNTNTGFVSHWSVFIDSNQDSVFDVDETVYEGSGTGLISGNFSLPDTALAGYTRMRVSMKSDSLPTPCGSFSNGQVVDYRVLVPEAVVDVTAPSIISVVPEDNSDSISVGSSISVQFSEELNVETIDLQSVILSASGGAVTGSLDFDSVNKVLTMTPSSPLEYGVAYTLEINDSIQDIAGNFLQTAFISGFVTAEEETGGVSSISGNVSAFGSQLQGISINLMGDTSLTAISSNVGSFSFNDLPAGTYTISASEPGYTFTPASISLDVNNTDVSSIEFIGEAITQPFTNGDFATGDFSGFTLYETNNGHTSTSVVVTNITASGAPNYAAQIAAGVTGSNHIGNDEGGGFYQAISLQDGSLNVAMDIAADSSNGNGGGGIVEILFDGVSMASHNFGSLSKNTKEYATLSFNLPNVTEGAHELRIQSTRQYLTTSVYHQIDNIVLSGTSTID